ELDVSVANRLVVFHYQNEAIVVLHVSIQKLEQTSCGFQCQASFNRRCPSRGRPAAPVATGAASSRSAPRGSRARRLGSASPGRRSPRNRRGGALASAGR